MGRYTHRNLVTRIFGTVKKPPQTRANSLFTLAYEPNKYIRPDPCLVNVGPPPLRRNSARPSDSLSRTPGHQQAASARPSPLTDNLARTSPPEPEQGNLSTPSLSSPAPFTPPSPGSSTSSELGPDDDPPPPPSRSKSKKGYKRGTCFTKDERGRYICKRCQSLFHRSDMVTRHHAQGTCTPGKPAPAFFCTNPLCNRVFHSERDRDKHVANGTLCATERRIKINQQLKTDGAH